VGDVFLKFGRSSVIETVYGTYDEIMGELRSFSSDVEGLDILLDEIDGLKDLELLRKLTDAYDVGDGIYDAGFVRDDFFNSHLMVLARLYLRKPFFSVSASRITFLRLSHDYKFFEYFYYMNSGKPLSVGDMEDLYYGGLGERVMLLLDKFDEAETTPFIDAEFFKALKSVKMKNEGKNLFKKLIRILGILESKVHFVSIFRSYIVLFLTFLCFCGAAADGRGLVSEVDVVRAFRAYIKLMRTDVTRYKAMRGFVEPVGFLVCDNCGGYYSLLPGESPEDFSDVCDCGGRWEYRENPDYSSGFGGSSSLTMRLKMCDPALILRLWGFLFVLIGVVAIIAYLGYFNFPFLLPVGVFFVFSGLLPFIVVHRFVGFYHAGFILSLGILSFILGGYVPGVTFICASIFVLRNALKIR